MENCLVRKDNDKDFCYKYLLCNLLGGQEIRDFDNGFQERIK